MTFDPASYEERVARFRWEIPDDFDFARDVIDVWAEDRGRLAACWPIGSGEGRATFWDLRDHSRRLAGVLRAKGVGHGEAVAIVAPLGFDFAVALIAASRVGAVAVPIEPRAPANAVSAALRAAKPAAIVASAAVARRLGRPKARARIVVSGRVPAWIDATAAPSASVEERVGSSDSVAVAFGNVRHSRRWIYAQRWIAEFWLDLRRTDLVGAIGSVDDPLRVALGTFAPWMAGAAVAWAPASRGSVRDWLSRYPISTLAAPPEIYGDLLASGPIERGELRHCIASGSIVPEIARRWHEGNGLSIHAGFGRPECPVVAAHLRGLPVRAGSIGRPFPGHDVVVLADESRESAAGEEGDLAIRGRPPTLAANGGRETGAHRFGVRARRDEQGYLWLARTLA